MSLLRFSRMCWMTVRKSMFGIMYLNQTLSRNNIQGGNLRNISRVDVTIELRPKARSMSRFSHGTSLSFKNISTNFLWNMSRDGKSFLKPIHSCFDLCYTSFVDPESELLFSGSHLLNLTIACKTGENSLFVTKLSDVVNAEKTQVPQRYCSATDCHTGGANICKNHIRGWGAIQIFT